MKIDESMYVAPTVKTVEISAQTIICESGGISDMIVDDEDAGNLFN